MNEAFFRPLSEALAIAANRYPCEELPDDQWLRMGVERVLEGSPSGRAFLQEHGLRFDKPAKLTTYFASLRSARRVALAREINLALVAALNPRLCDRLASIPELARYECFATDGHWHESATHDSRHEGRKMAVGHFYSLNLRSHTLGHLAAGRGLHEHDMSALKRVKPTGLRQRVAQGLRVLLVHDKAAIDLHYWDRCRRERAVYFLSMVKENMVFEMVSERGWNQDDARNHGVMHDWVVRSREGHLLRLVMYQDPQTGTVYEFLTNEMDLPPGVIAELYRRRWEIEKVFDQIKNKLGQQKAWGSSDEAKEAQALLIAITHNLLLVYEQELEKRHQATNLAEDQRRSQRARAAEKSCEKMGLQISALVAEARRATQRSVKFIRWLRQAIRDHLAEGAAVLHLKALYAQL